MAGLGKRYQTESRGAALDKIWPFANSKRSPAFGPNPPKTDRKPNNQRFPFKSEASPLIFLKLVDFLLKP